jgi:hypothetical protein
VADTDPFEDFARAVRGPLKKLLGAEKDPGEFDRLLTELYGCFPEELKPFYYHLLDSSD